MACDARHVAHVRPCDAARTLGDKCLDSPSLRPGPTRASARVAEIWAANGSSPVKELWSRTREQRPLWAQFLLLVRRKTERTMKPTANGSSDIPQPATAGKLPVPCRCVDWYSEGEARVVEHSGMRIVVRYVGRKGRRGRIVIEAPDGTTFR